MGTPGRDNSLVMGAHPMTKREQALIAAKIAGYHQDSKMFTRLIIECRVNRQAMNSAWFAGGQAKLAGVRCNCIDCNPKTLAAESAATTNHKGE